MTPAQESSQGGGLRLTKRIGGQTKNSKTESLHILFLRVPPPEVWPQRVGPDSEGGAAASHKGSPLAQKTYALPLVGSAGGHSGAL